MNNFADKSLIDMAAEFKQESEDEQERINRYDERRPLSNGLVKDTLTGFVDEPPWRDKDDIPDDLGSNRG